MRNKRYGILSLQKQFPEDGACLQFIFDTLYRRKCSCGGVYRRIQGRRQFQCSKCRFQVAPTAGTVFHKSETPLVLWFHAILAFLNAKGGISAKQLERDLEISYKCAWRILALIRRTLDNVPRLYTRDLAYSDIVALVARADLGIRRKKRRGSAGVYLA
jgi:transposase